MASVANLGVTDDDYVAVTKDGETYEGDAFKAVMVCLADCTEDTLADLKIPLDFFRRTTKAFIGSLSSEDLKTFVMHHTALKFARVMGGLESYLEDKR